jgi:hypothetical protein
MGVRAALIAFAVAAVLAATATTTRAQTVFTLSETAVECLEPLGAAPELRELARRTGGTDPGPMRAFMVGVSAATADTIRAAFDDLATGRHEGFEQTRGGRVRLDVFADGLDTEAGGVTTAMPRDGYLMFTMVEGVVDHLLAGRPRCGARRSLDKAPFRALLRSQRETMRAMLDQERQ